MSEWMPIETAPKDGTDHKTKLDKAADAILAAMEHNVKHLPKLEQDAKWRAFRLARLPGTSRVI